MKRIYSRASELVAMLERKYITLLEELRFREEELLSKDELTPLEYIELLGIRASIRVISEELELPYHEDEQYSSLIVLEKRKEAAYA